DVFRLLQWKCPPTRWAWKNPSDVAFLEAVRSVYPDARFIWTHRDPLHALTSVCSLLEVVGAPASDHFDAAAVGPRQTELRGHAIDRGLETRKAIGDESFVDFYMADLVRDPIAAMAALYAGLGWPFTSAAEQAMRAWSQENPQHGRGEHEPDGTRFGLDREA